MLMNKSQKNEYITNKSKLLKEYDTVQYFFTSISEINQKFKILKESIIISIIW